MKSSDLGRSSQFLSHESFAFLFSVLSTMFCPLNKISPESIDALLDSKRMILLVVTDFPLPIRQRLPMFHLCSNENRRLGLFGLFQHRYQRRFVSSLLQEFSSSITHSFILGSKASRKPSANKLKPIMITDKVAAGIHNRYGKYKNVLYPSLQHRSPMEAEGGVRPRPMKLKSFEENR